MIGLLITNFFDEIYSSLIDEEELNSLVKEIKDNKGLKSLMKNVLFLKYDIKLLTIVFLADIILK